MWISNQLPHQRIWHKRRHFSRKLLPRKRDIIRWTAKSTMTISPPWHPLTLLSLKICDNTTRVKLWGIQWKTGCIWKASFSSWRRHKVWAVIFLRTIIGKKGLAKGRIRVFLIRCLGRSLSRARMNYTTSKPSILLGKPAIKRNRKIWVCLVNKLKKPMRVLFL